MHEIKEEKEQIFFREKSFLVTNFTVDILFSLLLPNLEMWLGNTVFFSPVNISAKKDIEVVLYSAALHSAVLIIQITISPFYLYHGQND